MSIGNLNTGAKDSLENPVIITLEAVGKMLFVVYMERIVDDTEMTRIISARPTTNYEQRIYADDQSF